MRYIAIGSIVQSSYYRHYLLSHINAAKANRVARAVGSISGIGCTRTAQSSVRVPSIDRSVHSIISIACSRAVQHIDATIGYTDTVRLPVAAAVLFRTATRRAAPVVSSRVTHAVASVASASLLPTH